jgi:hypothetical protein
VTDAPQTAPTFAEGQRVSVRTGSVRTPCIIEKIHPEVVRNGQVIRGAQADVTFARGSSSRRFLSSLEPLT